MRLDEALEIAKTAKVDVEERADGTWAICGTKRVMEAVATLLHFTSASSRSIGPSEGGYIVANGNKTAWRRWGVAGPEWTSHRDQALRFARRLDAETFAREDNDAWFVEPFAGAEPYYVFVEEGEQRPSKDWQSEFARQKICVACAPGPCATPNACWPEKTK